MKVKALICDERRQEMDVPLAFGKDILKGRPVKKIYDAETGWVFPFQYNPVTQKHELGELNPGCFGIGDRGVRLIVVE